VTEFVNARFSIDGVPVPQGSKIGGHRKDGSIFMREAVRSLPAWREHVINTLREQKPDDWEPMALPAMARLKFWLPRPKNRPKTIDVLPIVKPDVDKLLRAILDATKIAGVVVDDAMFWDVHPSKRYAIDPVLLPKIYIEGFHRPTPGVDVSIAWRANG
jgi:Holliday junction resolvase RusA-like endonuclease